MHAPYPPSQLHTHTLRAISHAALRSLAYLESALEHHISYIVNRTVHTTSLIAFRLLVCLLASFNSFHLSHVASCNPIFTNMLPTPTISRVSISCRRSSFLGCMDIILIPEQWKEVARVVCFLRYTAHLGLNQTRRPRSCFSTA